ncbi:MAG: erythromycin esterase family protein [Oligoflexales bacterium]
MFRHSALIFGIMVSSPGTSFEVNPNWAKWARESQHPLSRIVTQSDDQFEDLAFLQGLLQDKRIVQLGESSHGSKEYTSGKIRLIKYLHEKQGFNVIAFESGLFECTEAWQNQESKDAVDLMRSCIFGGWHTEETLELFHYLKDQAAAGTPLALTGFDPQLSSGRGDAHRTKVVVEAVRLMDSDYAQEVQTLFVDFYDLNRKFFEDFGTDPNKARGTVRQYRKQFQGRFNALSQFFSKNKRRYMSDYGWPESKVRWIQKYGETPKQLIEVFAQDLSDRGAINMRDYYMAENLAWLCDTIYPSEKIIVWAHNAHIAHDANVWTTYPMGYFLKKRFAESLYSIGLYAYAGETAGDKGPVPIRQHIDASLESTLHQSGAKYAFFDFSREEYRDASSFLFEPFMTQYWGVTDDPLTLKKSYDGVLFLEESSLPTFLGPLMSP